MSDELSNIRELLKQGDRVRAVRELNIILENGLQDAEAHALLAECIMFFSDADAAGSGLSLDRQEEMSLSHIGEAVRLRPDDMSLRLRRASLLNYWHDDDPSLALAEYTNVLRRDPNNPYALSGITMTDLSLTPEQRLDMYERIVELVPSSDAAHASVALALYHLRRTSRIELERARRHALEALRLNVSRKTLHLDGLVD